jgi:hypothetical protein
MGAKVDWDARYYDYEECAIINGDIVRTEAHPAEETVREVEK